MTAAHAPYQIPAHNSIDAPVSAAVAFVGRSFGALAHGWRFAEACCRISGCRDDAAPMRCLDGSIVDRANAETSVY